MTTRARLRYFDDTGTERIIGQINQTGGGAINEFTLRNSGTQFTNVTIRGGSELFNSFPTSEDQVTTQNDAAGPEIFVDVYDTQNNEWDLRDRVYAESQGVVSNDGDFKHKRLYGFEKYTGVEKVNVSDEQDADASPVTTNIVDALQAVLPSGYVVESPNDVTVPTVEKYTFIGDRQKAYKELRENYEWLIWFTSETDGSGNYKVYFQPQGYGGQVDTFEKGVDPVYFDKWTKGDDLTKITEAEVFGTDSDGNRYSATASTNPNDGRFVRSNVGYLQSDSEALNIAENLIAAENDGDAPETTEHGKITVPIDQPPANNLNASVQVINESFEIDDLFTVVEQTDFFHESKTSYSFEFEKELINRDQKDKKDLNERNSELISSTQEDVGNQNVDADTEDVIDSYDSHNSQDHPHDVGGKQTTGSGGAASDFSDDLVDGSFSVASNTTVSIASANISSFADQQFALWYISFRVQPDRTANTSAELQAIAPKIRVRQDRTSGSTFKYPSDNGLILYGTALSPDGSTNWQDVNYQLVIKVPNVDNGSDEVLEFETGGTALTGVRNIQRVGEGEHDHSVDFETDRAIDNNDGSNNNTNASDGSAGDTTSLNATGSTDAQNINVGSEDNISRG